ncbi:ATP-grasp domain-containing protein [Pseudomonas fluorescens]|uniref:ATP-grasp domain-containing protein n=1 Tax=Pseudomonas TaxID=286 RepID=UPI000F040EBC|nr:MULTISPECIES: ATP-grasp domain-containing protein [Pseudomonas]MBD8088632.1 ATP-grasp domain-containing protein [Pseudomonas fluorescens]MBD8681409.1 ATP-grasp domain-containing protein [Pseudomonas sp. CFBP 13719]
MLVVFQESSKDSLAQGLGIVTWYNEFRNEDYGYCVAREKAQEVLKCREHGIPYVVINKDVLGDNRVIDTNCDLKRLPADTTLVLRCQPDARLPSSIASFPKWLTPDEMKAVNHWPSNVAQADHFFKRHVMTIDRDLLAQLLQAQALSLPLFFKTVEKTDFHQVIYSHDELNKSLMTVSQARQLVPHKGAELEGLFADTAVLVLKKPDWFCEYRDQMIAGRVSLDTLEEGLIISDPMEILREESHKGEYRAYFINGQMSSISAYLDYDHCEVPGSIRDFAEAFGVANAQMAKGFVADFCMTPKGPALVEMNDFCYSGRYIDNDPGLLFTDLKRHFGDPSFDLIEPYVKVPSRQETEHPDPDRIAVDFGKPTELVFGSDDTLTLKASDKSSLVLERFMRAQANKHDATVDLDLQTANGLD